MSFGVKVWQFVTDGYKIPYPLPTDLNEKKAYVANAKALNSTTSVLSELEFPKVMNIKTSKEMWDKLISIMKEMIKSRRQRSKSLESSLKVSK